jgi:hypothetical protein
MHKLTKTIDRELRQIAAQLPQQHHHLTGRVKGSDILALHPEPKGPNGAPIDPERYYMLGKGEAVNHHRRLRKAYERGGREAVIKYLAKYVPKGKPLETQEREEVAP